MAVKYNVPIADLRRVNKLWSSDTIHLREILLIPVEQSDNQSTQRSKTRVPEGATIRRIPPKDLLYFPSATATNVSSPILSNSHEAAQRPRHPHASSTRLAQLFNGLPSTDALLSRLSLDSSRASELSDDGDHELTLVGRRPNGGPRRTGHARHYSEDVQRQLDPSSIYDFKPRKQHESVQSMKVMLWSSDSEQRLQTAQPSPSPMMLLPNSSP